MREAKTKTIGKAQYRVTPLGAKAGCRVLTRLTRLLGSALKGGDRTNAMVILGSGLEHLSEEDFSYFCDALAPNTELLVDGKTLRLSDVFDVHFTAEYAALVEWLLFAMEVNFGGFFDEVRGLSGVASLKAAAASQ